MLNPPEVDGCLPGVPEAPGNAGREGLLLGIFSLLLALCWAPSEVLNPEPGLRSQVYDASGLPDLNLESKSLGKLPHSALSMTHARTRNIRHSAFEATYALAASRVVKAGKCRTRSSQR